MLCVALHVRPARIKKRDPELSGPRFRSAKPVLAGPLAGGAVAAGARAGRELRVTDDQVRLRFVIGNLKIDRFEHVLPHINLEWL